MDWIAPLAGGLGALFVVMAGTGRYLLNRLTRLEADRLKADAAATELRDSDNAALRAEVQVLRQRVADGERREGVTRAEMDTTRQELNELHSALKTAMTEIAALRDQVTVLEDALKAERDEKAKAEARVKELSARVQELEATTTRLTIERDTLAGLIRDRMDAGERATDSSAPGEGKPSTKDVLDSARRVNAEADARLATGTHRRTGTAPLSGQQGG